MIAVRDSVWGRIERFAASAHGRVKLDPTSTGHKLGRFLEVTQHSVGYDRPANTAGTCDLRGRSRSGCLRPQDLASVLDAGGSGCVDRGQCDHDAGGDEFEGEFAEDPVDLVTRLNDVGAVHGAGAGEAAAGMLQRVEHGVVSAVEAFPKLGERRGLHPALNHDSDSVGAQSTCAPADQVLRVTRFLSPAPPAEISAHVSGHSGRNPP